MTLAEIKEAVDSGKKVHWASDIYVVEYDHGDYWIRCIQNDSYIGLTWMDGVTMNGEEEQFYVGVC